MLEWIATMVAVMSISWSLLPMIRHDAWWIRAFEFPRVQVAVLTCVVLGLYVAIAGVAETLDRVIIATLAACLLFQLVRIAPYTPLYPLQLASCERTRPDNELRILVANVLTPNRDAERLLAIIRGRQPDIVLAVETDDWWQDKLDALDAEYPHAVKYPLDNTYGMHLYSRLELSGMRIEFLVEDDVPSIHGDVILPSGHAVELHCLHPAPPSPTENESAAERDAELLAVAKHLEDNANSVVVMGDLNDVAWSYTTRLFQRLSNLLDPRIGRGMYSTFHARYPLLRWPLDHIFCSADFRLVKLERLPYFGSDHFPIFAILQHAAEAEKQHDEPCAERDDRKRAQEKIQKVDTREDALH